MSVIVCVPEEGQWLHPRLIRGLSEAEELRQAQLVGVAGWTVTIGLDPFRILNAQVIVDLLLKFGVGMNLVTHIPIYGS
jgi:DNA-binding transcriptional LysR family regulator